MEKKLQEHKSMTPILYDQAPQPHSIYFQLLILLAGFRQTTTVSDEHPRAGYVALA